MSWPSVLLAAKSIKTIARVKNPPNSKPPYLSSIQIGPNRIKTNDRDTFRHTHKDVSAHKHVFQLTKLRFGTKRSLDWRCCHMREVAGSTPGLDFYLLCELICVLLRLFWYKNIGFVTYINFYTTFLRI
jgi:hypothetical protein